MSLKLGRLDQLDRSGDLLVGVMDEKAWHFRGFVATQTPLTVGVGKYNLKIPSGVPGSHAATLPRCHAVRLCKIHSAWEPSPSPSPSLAWISGRHVRHQAPPSVWIGSWSRGPLGGLHLLLWLAWLALVQLPELIEYLGATVGIP
jgi:hypothetical protein